MNFLSLTFLFMELRRKDSLQFHLKFNASDSKFHIWFVLSVVVQSAWVGFFIISIISYFGHAEPAAFWQQSAVLASVTSRLAVPFILEMAKVLRYK